MRTNTLSETQPTVATIYTYKKQFLQDVLAGLTSTHKHLDSKYFYDATGDKLFQQIMHCPEYYPTRCEMEIIHHQRQQIVETIHTHLADYDVIELGAGDATKSIHLLQQMQETGQQFTYYPVDISGNIIEELEARLPQQLPGLRIDGLRGEYIQMLREASLLSGKNKLVLFMGANIGNFDSRTAVQFCRQIRQQLQPGDLLLTGFDLKKHPRIILDAYNDKQGITRAFNLNLLHRINKELNADFDTNQFDHYPCYDPSTGACKSYLVSLTTQQVHVDGITIGLEKDECIYMEISQKYAPEDIEQLAYSAGFSPITHFMDERNWFADCLWQA